MNSIEAWPGALDEKHGKEDTAKPHWYALDIG